MIGHFKILQFNETDLKVSVSLKKYNKIKLEGKWANLKYGLIEKEK